ncbi:MAG: exo-alpha-sialidase, partial [Thermoplasmata archaeon]|nr:exo-alpha-sialidase [Thermoplasmata archaeon]
MKETSSYVSRANGGIGIFAVTMFLMLFASTFGLGWISLGAVAGAPTPEALGDAGPDPTGGPGSGWIPDQLVSHSLGVDSWNCDIATGPGGSLHVVWQGNASIGGWQIFYSTSSDNGMTWSAQRGVAGSPDDETNPSIAINPDDGRMYVAYERWVAGNDAEIFVAWSDDGVSWNNVIVDPFPALAPQVNPSITVEHNWASPGYYVYVTFGFEITADNQNVYVYRSPDRGASWTQMLDRGGLDANVYLAPDMVYQEGPGGVSRLFVVYAQGTDLFDTTSIVIEWSLDFGGTWDGPSFVANESAVVEAPSIAASRDGDSLIIAWQRNIGTDYDIRYSLNGDPTAPGTGWSAAITCSPTGSNDANDLAPEVVADGEGTMNTTIGGNYHLIWTSDSPQYTLNYSSRRTDLTGGFGLSVDVTDVGGDPSRSYPVKGLTTQQRGSDWHAGLVYSSGRAVRYDIFYTTPGSRVTVDTDPAGLDVEVDFMIHTAPANFVWPAGTQHLLNALTQALGPTQRYVFDYWSDAGPDSHVVTATDVDTIY